MRSIFFLSLLAATRAAAQCPDGSPPPCRAASAARATAPLAGSIAVFPFTNRSPDSADSYLADALPEQIVGRLARVNELKVKSATAVSAQWRRTPDPMAAARALRVEWFVTGSIRRAGRQISVSAELVRASSGDGAWSAPFRRPDGDIGAVEEQIAESVAVAIVGRLAPSQALALRRTSSRNPEAYRLYLYGRALSARRTTGDIAAAVDAFAQATRLDPDFAAAWARLGHARGLQFQYGNLEGIPADSTLALGRVAVTRALALDSSVVDAWLTHGMIATLERDLASAHTRLARAIELDSLSADAYHTMGYVYSVDFLDLPLVGAPLFRRTLALNPDFRNAWRHLALLYRDEGRLAESEALLDTSLSFGAWSLGSSERSFLRFARGNAAGALSDLAAVDSASGFATSVPTLFRNVANARALYRVGVGDSTAARALLAAQLAAPPAARNLDAVALLELVLGSADSALATLQLLHDTPDRDEPQCGRGPCSTSLRTWRTLHNLLLAPLRTVAQFQRLLADTRPRAPWLEHR